MVGGKEEMERRGGWNDGGVVDGEGETGRMKKGWRQGSKKAREKRE